MANKHLKKEDLIKYAAGTLTGAERMRVTKHLAECELCSRKVVHVQVKKITGPCADVRTRFPQYAAHRLSGHDAAFVRDHIAVCDDCFKSYELLIEPYDSVDDFKARAKGAAKEIKVSLGTFDVSRYLVKDKGPSAAARKSAREISKGGVTLSLKNDGKGNLKTYVKSDKFNVSDVKVSIGRQDSSSFTPALSGITTKRGVASMTAGKPETASAGAGEYAVVLSGLKKRSNE